MDFTVRLREAILLIRYSMDCDSADLAAACSKSATVLLTAALERYVNSALDNRCAHINSKTWEELPMGAKDFLTMQIARRLRSVAGDLANPNDFSERKAQRLKRTVEEAKTAYQDPSSWEHFPEFGMFMEGAAAPERLNALLRTFRSDGKTLFDNLDGKPLDKAALGRTLTSLIDTRHSVAHALSSGTIPSANDVANWAVVAFVIARGIEDYLNPTAW